MTKNLCCYVLACASICSAAQTTYIVNQTVGAGSVTGTITTDGNLGTLTTGDIVAFNITINDGSGTTQLVNTQATATIFGSGVTATPTGLFLNYTLNSGLLIEGINTPTAGNNTYVCWEGGTLSCTNGPTGIDLCRNCPNGSNAGAQILSQSGTQAIASAPATATPEPSTILLVGLGAGILGLNHRKLILQRLGRATKSYVHAHHVNPPDAGGQAPAIWRSSTTRPK